MGQSGDFEGKFSQEPNIIFENGPLQTTTVISSLSEEDAN
jgi:hypothetical protein